MDESADLASSRPISRIGPDAAKTALAAGGMLAAFGAASCCALPVALSLLGIGAASLVGIGYAAAQYQQELLYAAVACLSAAGLVMWRQRQAPACASGVACSRPVARWTSLTAFGLGLAFLALTFWYDIPI
jgi:mercuric ion transport protein